MKKTICGISILVMGASLVSCRIQPQKRYNYKQVNEHRTLTLEFDDGFDFSASGCHGIQMSCPVKGKCTVCTDDVSEPVISYDIVYQGNGTKNTLTQFGMLRLTNDISEEGLLNVTIWDALNDQNLRQESCNVGEEGSLVCFNSTVDISVTLPRSFDTFNIWLKECDIEARDLSGQIDLFTQKHITAENIAFSNFRFNGMTGEEGVSVSTARFGDEKTDVYIASKGDVSYVMPEPSQMTERSDPDTITLKSDGGTVTVDMNGNTYYYIDVPYPGASPDSFIRSYTYMAGDAAMLAPVSLVDEEPDDEGIIITNGEYINTRRNNMEET